MGSTLEGLQCRLGVQLVLHSGEHFLLFRTVLDTELEQKDPRIASEVPDETWTNRGHPRVAEVARGKSPVSIFGMVAIILYIVLADFTSYC